MFKKFQKRFILFFAACLFMSPSFNVYAADTSCTTIPQPIVVDALTEEEINELTPDKFTSNIPLSQQNSINSVITPRSQSLYTYVYEKVSTEQDQISCFMGEHPSMPDWYMLPPEKPFFDMNTQRTVGVTISGATTWKKVNINVSLQASKSESINTPVKGYANRYCKIGVFSDVRPIKYNEIKIIRATGKEVSRSEYTSYVRLNTKYNGIYQFQRLKKINDYYTTVS